jgi:hypothetical protein
MFWKTVSGYKRSIREARLNQNLTLDKHLWFLTYVKLWCEMLAVIGRN